MPNKATSKMLARLHELQQKSEAMLFDRVSTAAAVLADVDYLADQFKGNVAECEEFLSDRYFREFAGLVHLRDMLRLLKARPDRSYWEKQRFNLRSMLDEVDAATRSEQKQAAAARQKPQPAAEQPSGTTKAPEGTAAPAAPTNNHWAARTKELESLKAELSEKTALVVRQEQSAQAQEHLISQLRKRVMELEQANAELLTEVEQLHGRLKQKQGQLAVA